MKHVLKLIFVTTSSSSTKASGVFVVSKKHYSLGIKYLHLFLAVKDCASKNGSCDFQVNVKIGETEVKIYQDFSVSYRAQTYSREQVIN
jgi:hypothetical protein